MTDSLSLTFGEILDATANHSCRCGLANLSSVAHRELKDAVRSRWLILYTIAFTVLGIAVSYVSSAGIGGSGLAGFGKTSAGLINLVLLIVPLMALTAGAGSIAGDRERGTLAYLLAQPVNRWEVLLGKYIGLAISLLMSICVGFGVCAVVLACSSTESLSAAGLVRLVGLTTMLAMASLSIGMLISSMARRSSVAVGTAVFVWLTAVLISDLGLMAGAIAFQLRIETLFGLALINPLQVFKIWSLGAIGASVDVLGPAGLYASDTFGDSLGWILASVLAGWIALPLALAVAIFGRRSPV